MRKAFIVYVNLNETPGTFHSQESAQNAIRDILQDRLFVYDPSVSLAPRYLQPSWSKGSLDAPASVLDPTTLSLFENKDFKRNLEEFHDIYNGQVHAGWTPQITRAAWNLARCIDGILYPDTENNEGN
jgi:hypothetical protein